MGINFSFLGRFLFPLILIAAAGAVFVSVSRPQVTLAEHKDIAVVGEYNQPPNNRQCPDRFSLVYQSEALGGRLIGTCVRDNLDYNLQVAVVGEWDDSRRKCPDGWEVTALYGQRTALFATCQPPGQVVKVAAIPEYKTHPNKECPSGYHEVFVSEFLGHQLGTCASDRSDQQPPADIPGDVLSFNKENIGPSQVAPGQEATFKISYSATGDPSANSQLSCGFRRIIETGWIRISDTLPSGFEFVSADPIDPIVGCAGPGFLVWGKNELDPDGDGSASGQITLSARATQLSCQAGAGGANTAAIQAIGSSGAVDDSAVGSANIAFNCPGLTITGNVSAAGGAIQTSSNIDIAGPAVVTANGQIGITQNQNVHFFSNYSIDTSPWKNTLNRAVEKLLADSAKPFNSAQFNQHGGIYKADSPVTLSGLVKDGTIIVEGNGDVVVQDMQPEKLGIIYRGTGRIILQAINLKNVIVFAPNGAIDFGTGSRNLAFKGVFIAKQFIGIGNHNGRVSYAPELVDSPPVGFSEVVKPLIREGIP